MDKGWEQVADMALNWAVPRPAKASRSSAPLPEVSLMQPSTPRALPRRGLLPSGRSTQTTELKKKKKIYSGRLPSGNVDFFLRTASLSGNR